MPKNPVTSRMDPKFLEMVDRERKAVQWSRSKMLESLAMWGMDAWETTYKIVLVRSLAVKETHNGKALAR